MAIKNYNNKNNVFKKENETKKKFFLIDSVNQTNPFI